MNLFDNADTKIFALGGLGEVGKNMYCVMHNNEIIIIDSGVMFPEDELLGIDYVLPEYTFLKQNQSKIKALFITHGHEDHIGGIPFLLQHVDIPVIYAPKQACELIKRKIEERNIKYKNIQVYTEETRIKYKYFDIEFFATTHSIPDSHGISITTPNGTVVMTGDFKFDFTPIGPMANLHKMAEIGKKGVRLLLSDSTNALVDDMSESESKVDEALGELFDKHKDNRLIIATFASNIYRLKHIVETCRENKRKIALFGRSMETSIDISLQGGYLTNKDIFVSTEEANNLPPSEICLLCTGSQGEPLAALSRIANGTHRQIKVNPDDVVIFSSSPIPGNSSSISKTINKLYLKGVQVYTNSMESDIHTSGHASSGELKLMMRLIKPEYFMPYHGEYRMLKAHIDLAIDCGISKDKTFLLQNGDILSMNKDKIIRKGSVPASDIYVDGKRIGDIGNVVLRDRKMMANEGILVVICNIDLQKKQLLIHPNITTRGFILVNQNEKLLKDIENKASNVINNYLKKKEINVNDLKTDIISELSPFLFQETGRRPLILPVIMEIKKLN